MQKKRISQIITLLIVIAIIVIAVVVLTRSGNSISVETAECIGDNSVLYTQLGCHFCQQQEDLFGDKVQYLTTIDCFDTPEKCQDITGTPTWVINNTKYEGVQTIDKLKELTGC